MERRSTGPHPFNSQPSQCTLHPPPNLRAALQVVTQYSDRDVPHVLEACERMEAHLTAAGEQQRPQARSWQVFCGSVCPWGWLCWRLGGPLLVAPSLLLRGHHYLLPISSLCCSCLQRHPLHAAHPGQHRKRHHLCRHPCPHHRQGWGVRGWLPQEQPREVAAMGSSPGACCPPLWDLQPLPQHLAPTPNLRVPRCATRSWQHG